MAVGCAAMAALDQAIGVQQQAQLPAVDAYIDLPLGVRANTCSAWIPRAASRRRWQASRLLGGSTADQKLAGVLALMISASSGPMFLKLCGRVVGM